MIARTPGTYRPAWWLPSPHLQAVWVAWGRSRRLIDYRREVLPTLDGDELVLDHAEAGPESPRVLLLHGMEGSSYSAIVQGMASLATRAGLNVTALNFRSCARDPADIGRWLPNRTFRLYHSGETTDLDLVVRTLRLRHPAQPLTAFGLSLGGNVLLKWLGEREGSADLHAAVTLSVPFDLAAGSRNLEKGVGPFYMRYFLRTMKAKAASLAGRFPDRCGAIDFERVSRARTFREFDDAAVAPVFGFSGADDYYSRASSIGFLHRIRVPTLAIGSTDDPFLPEGVEARARESASAAVEFLWTRRGGHGGFISGVSPARATYWAEQKALAWLLERLAGPQWAG